MTVTPTAKARIVRARRTRDRDGSRTVSTTRLNGIRREHIEAWLVALGEEGKAAATLSVYYRSLQPFFAWAVSAGEIDAFCVGELLGDK